MLYLLQEASVALSDLQAESKTLAQSETDSLPHGVRMTRSKNPKILYQVHGVLQCYACTTSRQRLKKHSVLTGLDLRFQTAGRL